MFQRIKIRSYEIGLYFRDREFRGLLHAGTHWLFDPWRKARVEVVSRREPWLAHKELDAIVRSGALIGQAEVLDLKDYQRALIWLDGRFSHVATPGLHAWWTGLREVRAEIIDARRVRFVHPDLPVIARNVSALNALEQHQVEAHHVGVLFLDGDYTETLLPGRYAFWKNVAQVKLVPVDLRETTLDIGGQELMTADKVTLRLNAVISYRVVDAKKAITTVDNACQTLYREAQLALRAVVGARELDAFLTGKDAVAEELHEMVRRRAADCGLEALSLGIRDVILPGEMKDLMNKVTEAKKAAEANLIVRREETAAMRSQVNTARLLADNPTLMRLRELEALEKIAIASKLNVVLGEKGLTDRVVNLL